MTLEPVSWRATQYGRVGEGKQAPTWVPYLYRLHSGVLQFNHPVSVILELVHILLLVKQLISLEVLQEK